MTWQWMPADAVGKECSGAAEPGTKVLAAELLRAYGGHSVGIYSCREVRGGGALSLHGEGRAYDHAPRSGDLAEGYAVLDALAAVSDVLGVQRVIWDHAVYDEASPAGRPYRGADPHTSHLHIEQTRAAAASLDSETARLALSGPTEHLERSMLILRRRDDLEDSMRWLYLDGTRYRLEGWAASVQPLIDAGVPQTALSDAQLRGIPEA